MSQTQPRSTDVPDASTPSRYVGRYRLWVWALASLAAGIALGWVLARYMIKDEAARQYQSLQSRFELTMAQNQHDLDTLQARVDALQGQLLVEASTRKSLESALGTTQSELGQARDKLAFFDRLLPPGPSGSVNVRALDIEQRGPTLQYKALLMRNAPGADAFSGTMEFVANGLQDGKRIKIPLKPAQAANSIAGAAIPSGNPLALEFDEFQRAEGLLSLPDDFAVQTVTLNVLEGKTIRVSRTVNLPSAD